MPGPRLTTVVFDLDGTLIDSLPDLTATLNRLLAGDGLSSLSPDEVKTMVGDGVAVLVAKAFGTAGMRLGDDQLDIRCDSFLDDYESNGAVLSCPYPGVEKTLRCLKNKGYLMAVCTNKPGKAANAILVELGLRHFFTVVVGGDAIEGVRKPDPRPLLLTLERLGVAPKQTVMVGDSENDMATAKAAGIAAIAVAYGYAKGVVGKLDAAIIIDRFNELPNAIEQLP